MTFQRKQILLAILSLAILISAAWGTYAVLACRAKSAGSAGAYSTVAALALKDLKQPAEQAKITSLDQSFVDQYNRVCAQLCQRRELLAKRLGFANAGDAESRELLGLITADQSRLEQLTWQHIVSIRDSLPAGQRETFVQAVQAQWAQGMARMKHQVAECSHLANQGKQCH